MHAENILSQMLPPDCIRQPHPLKARIKALKIKQTALAAALLCSDSDLSRWLNNRRTMPLNVERRLNELLDQVEARWVEQQAREGTTE